MGKKSKRPGTILKADPHNYGIDLLRCISMFMILVLHLMNQGGVVTAVRGATPTGWNYYLLCTVRLVCLGAVNLYGIISGYVMLNTSFKLRRFLSLWLQVVVIALFICTVAQIFFPQQMLQEYWICSALPVSQRLYWYFTCYTGVFLLSPVMNRGIRTLTDRQATGLLFGCIALFCVIAGIGYSYQGDAFYLVGGYSVLWLLVLYVIGACLKKSGLFSRTNAWKLLAIMAVCLGATYAWHFCKLPPFLTPSKPVAGKYINPFLVIFDICLFVLLARMEFRNNVLKRILRFVSPLTFSAYLLHLHPVIWNYLKNRFLFVAHYPTWAQLPFVLAVALAAFIAGVFLDWLRTLLFRLLHVDAGCAALERMIRNIVDKFSRFLLKRF